MRCAPARWPRSAKCRSRSITARSTQRRCSCCSPALISTAPATSKPSLNFGPHIEAALGWIDRIWRRRRRRLCRIPARHRAGPRQSRLEGSFDAIFHADGTLAEGDDRARRGPGLCLRRQARGRPMRAALGCTIGRLCWNARRQELADTLRSRVLVPGIGDLCASARRRQKSLSRADLQCRTGAVQRHREPGARRRGGRGLLGRRSFRAGASAPWPKARPATTRCPTTTARSGRTTTR